METQTQILEQLKHLESLIIQGSKDVFTTSEAALYLGISKSYLYKLTSANRIEFFCPEGKQIYFSRESLNEFLLRNKVSRISTSEELQDKALAYINSGKKGGRK
jgi:excisionase family DNA binding protein